MSTEAEREIAGLFGQLVATDDVFGGVLIWRDPATGEFKAGKVGRGDAFPPRIGLRLRQQADQGRKRPSLFEEVQFGITATEHHLSPNKVYYATSSVALPEGTHPVGGLVFPTGESVAETEDVGDISDVDLATATQALKDYYSEVLGSPKGYLRSLKERISGAETK